MTHLLDTTALLAHFLDENGADQVEELLARGPGHIALAAPSWVEFHTRLRELVPDPGFRDAAFRQYTTELTTFLPLDSPATSAAIRLREETPGRLPLADAMIAGTAHAADLTLVHRDPHFDAIPGLKMLRLPDK
jgi:predicted nucleic acid-binding protein